LSRSWSLVMGRFQWPTVQCSLGVYRPSALPCVRSPARCSSFQSAAVTAPTSSRAPAATPAPTVWGAKKSEAPSFRQVVSAQQAAAAAHPPTAAAVVTALSRPGTAAARPQQQAQPTQPAQPRQQARNAAAAVSKPAAAAVVAAAPAAPAPTVQQHQAKTAAAAAAPTPATPQRRASPPAQPQTPATAKRLGGRLASLFASSLGNERPLHSSSLARVAVVPISVPRSHSHSMTPIRFWFCSLLCHFAGRGDVSIIIRRRGLSSPFLRRVTEGYSDTGALQQLRDIAPTHPRLFFPSLPFRGTEKLTVKKSDRPGQSRQGVRTRRTRRSG